MLAVVKNGVYKIDYGQLKKMGINPGKVDPQKIKLFGNSGGMLPQPNSSPRPADLTEKSIYIYGGDDGKFDKEDYILFYAQGPDRSYFDEHREIFYYERNLYDDKNYCFLTISDANGKRLSANEAVNLDAPVLAVYDDYVYHEFDNTNELKSGREWFGENFSLVPEQTFKLDMAGVVRNTTLKIASDVMGQSYIGSSFKLFLNDKPIGEQSIPPIFNSQYTVKGKHAYDTLLVNANTVSADAQNVQELTYQYVKSSGYSIGYLDRFIISYKRRLALYTNQTIFLSHGSLQNEHSNFELSSIPDKCTIWEITNPDEPSIQPFTFSTGTANFTCSTSTLREFIVFNNQIPTAEFVTKITNQNLHGQPTPNLLIITHSDFEQQAQRLADHRRSYSGLTTLVATTEEVYNEFSSGRRDVSAIRDFARHLYSQGPSTLKSILLFGRGSYDYKNRLFYNTNLVPVYESRNSLEPLETYSSDDFFGFMENNEGEWGEDPTQYHSLDIGVGRLPVKTIDEATTIVDKLIDYDVNTKTFGAWRKEIVFVADDGDGNIHQNQADKLAQKIETLHTEFDTRRIFIDSYVQELKPAGEFSPTTNAAIQDAIDRGAVIINYTGHGGEKLWAQEKIFDNTMISNLDNKVYPLFVTATCEFGRNDNPAEISSAELSIIKKNGGAIGMVTTARPVNSSTNFELNQAFYDALFTRESNAFLTLGEIFRRTKNNSMSGVANRNFSLLGDPSMTLAFPSHTVVATEITNEEGDDLLKALSTVTVKGEVQDNSGTLMDSYEGTVDVTLFDKKTSFTTLGNENPPFAYKQWHNNIFRGSASVMAGRFEFNFVVPKNIAYQVGQGKLSLYAYTGINAQDAMGASSQFDVGESNSSPGTDTTPPEIRLFMGDETFMSGGTISSDSYLIADLQDASGINISGYGIGNSIVGILDDTETFILNDYYRANADDFTRGKIKYRIKGLLPGQHTILVKVWDTHNNPSQAIITFNVSAGDHIKIEQFANHPNPFFETTTLFFRHNRAGDDLEGNVGIYDLTGQLLKTYTFIVTSSNYKVELPKLDSNLDFGKKLPSGLYFAKLVVRSLTNGSKNENVTKLIILN